MENPKGKVMSLELESPAAAVVVVRVLESPAAVVV